MLEGATVTMPLSEFDELRANSNEFRRIAQQIAACFEYEFKNYEQLPDKCKTCKKENPDCTKCKVFKENPPWEEILTVDTEQLINFAKQYALYGKDVETDVEEIKIIKKKKRGGSE